MMPTKLSPEQLRTLARQGAKNRIAELKAEIAAIHREFPELADWLVSEQVSRERRRLRFSLSAARDWLTDRVTTRRLSMLLAYYIGRLLNLRGFRSQLAVHYAPAEVEMTRPMPCSVSVRNVGHRTWRTRGWFPVQLSYHWRLGDLAIEGLRIPLPADLEPGQEVVIKCNVVAPLVAGDYVLEFDLIREFVAWFCQAGSPTVQIPCAIRDYDYTTTYQQSDLEKDYWSPVGPATKEEYEYLGREKRKTLIALGMTEHSRVLDVGCGTGQLAQALEDYLSDKGVYYGTDIAQDVVTFCQKKFRRPNFVFFKNDMIHVPVEGMQFDFIFLASVFTHMYPDEIKAMLVDLKRLLAPAGLIVADLFVSPDVQTYAGSRLRVQLNERLVNELFDQTGLQYEMQGCIMLPDGARRLGYVFRH